MNKALKIFFIIFIAIYVLCVLAISIFILMQNSYGTSEFKDNVYVLIDKNNETSTYEKNSLIIVKKEKITDLLENDEVFVYKTDSNKNIYPGVGTIIEVVSDTANPHILLENDESVYRDEFIIGKKIKVINNIGGIILFLESKWVFFFLIILPCSLLAVYEVYYIFKNLVFETKSLE